MLEFTISFVGYIIELRDFYLQKILNCVLAESSVLKAKIDLVNSVPLITMWNKSLDIISKLILMASVQLLLAHCFLKIL